MEVHFCDLCNESVPQRDLTEGRAFLRKGRVVCASCDVAMGGVASPSYADPPTETEATAPGAASGAPGLTHTHVHPAPAGAGLAMLLASMAILLTAAVAVLLFERLDESGRNASQDISGLRTDIHVGLAEMREDLSAGSEGRAAKDRLVATEIAGLLAREDSRVKAQAAASTRIVTSLDELAKKVEGLSGTATELARHDRQLSELAGSLAEIRTDVGLIAQKVVELEERPIAIAPVQAEPDEPTAEQPGWTALLEELKSPSSGARWSAVQALGDTADPAVAPHLVPMLADTDIFVRMATARVLGDLAAPAGVPALIDALEDQEASVREAAVVSLRSITGKNFKFDPTAGDSERSKRVKAWRDWWRRDGESALGSA